MLHKSIVIGLFALSIGNAFAGNEQAQRMILGGDFAGGPALPAALAYKQNGHDQGRALLAPEFVAGAYVGTSATVGVDGHEQARRLIVGE